MAKNSNSIDPDVEMAGDGAEGGAVGPRGGSSVGQVHPVAEGADFLSDHGSSAMFENIKCRLIEEILFQFEFPDEITQQTILLLKQLTRDDVLAVHWCAEAFVEARRIEVGHRDGDMEEVLEKFDAILAVLRPWLKQNGISHAVSERCAS
jgi:hypothetical protein